MTDDRSDASETITFGEPERWRYHVQAPYKPFVHPVRTPAGRILSTDAPASHPWHHGLWFALKYVNGENFWEEFDEYGVALHHDDILSNQGVGSFGHRLRWVRPDGRTTVLDEERRLTHVPLADDAYAIDWTTRLTPRVDTTLDREPHNGIWGGYSGLAFRGRGDLTGTRLLHEEVGEVERLDGVPGRWVDLSGPIDDGEGGVAVLDHPTNPRHPVPWYASTEGIIYGDEWGNFVNAAFVWDGPLEVVAGTTLTFTYRIVVHDGIWDADRLVSEYERYRSRP